MTKEELEYIEECTNKAENLIGSMTDINTKQNRDKLYRAYDLLFKVNKYIEKIKGGN